MLLVYRFTQMCFAIFFKVSLPAFFNVRVAGREYVAKLCPPFVLAANHQSFFDPILIFLAAPLRLNFFPVRFIALKQYFAVPSFTLFFWCTGALPVTRDPRVSLEEKLAPAMKALAEGTAVGIFPEGRRNDFGPGHMPEKVGRGVAYLATHGNVRILPVRLWYDVKPALFPLPFFGRRRVCISLGEPFSASGEPFIGQDLSSVAMRIMKRVHQLPIA